MLSGFLVEGCGVVFLVRRQDKSGCVVEFPVNVRAWWGRDGCAARGPERERVEGCVAVRQRGGGGGGGAGAAWRSWCGAAVCVVPVWVPGEAGSAASLSSSQGKWRGSTPLPPSSLPSSTRPLFLLPSAPGRTIPSPFPTPRSSVLAPCILKLLVLVAAAASKSLPFRKSCASPLS